MDPCADIRNITWLSEICVVKLLLHAIKDSFGERLLALTNDKEYTGIQFTYKYT